jgi:selenocysteine lyase/cysteine desulfurase
MPVPAVRRTAFGEYFDVPDGYLNTASIGIPPVPVADAVAAAITDWRHGAAQPPDFDPAVAIARAAFAELVGFDADQVAIGATVSGLLATVAASIPDRSRVLVAGGEFTSVSFPFAAQAGRGVSVVEADLEELPRRATEFDVVAVSVVQSADGRMVDLEELRAARAAGTTVVLDVSQSLGWHVADVSWADVVVGVGYKWLGIPRGAAWMAVAPELELVSSQAGWFAGDDPWATVYGLPLRLAAGARGYDTSPAWYSHVGAAVALPWLLGVDRAAVQEHCVGLADGLRVRLGMKPAGSAIVSVRRPGALARLAAAGVVGAGRAGAARLSFHLYNTEADVERAVAALS